MKYYKVVARAGHVGKNYYVPVSFYVEAQSKKEAAAQCRSVPRVKHHDKHAILSVEEITKGYFLQGLEENKLNPYLNVGCIQEQRRFLDEKLVRIPMEFQPCYRKRHSLRNSKNDYDPVEELELRNEFWI